MDYEGYENEAENLNFDDEDYKKAIEFLEKYINKVESNLFDIDYNVEIEID